MTDDDEQAMLSAYGGGDVTDIDLSPPAGPGDIEAKREVTEYAERVASGGWEVALVTGDVIWWQNPDGRGTYKLERKAAGWHGVHGGRDCSPSYTEDLQDALDKAGAFLEDHPVDRDTEDGPGGDG